MFEDLNKKTNEELIAILDHEIKKLESTFYFREKYGDFSIRDLFRLCLSIERILFDRMVVRQDRWIELHPGKEIIEKEF
jgi:hypothetical protein